MSKIFRFLSLFLDFNLLNFAVKPLHENCHNPNVYLRPTTSHQDTRHRESDVVFFSWWLICLTLFRRPIRKQFLIAGNQTIYAWARTGIKFPECENITDKTSNVTCKVSTYHSWPLWSNSLMLVTCNRHTHHGTVEMYIPGPVCRKGSVNWIC